MPRTQEDIYRYLKSKLDPEDSDDMAIPNLLQLISNSQVTPMMSRNPKPLTPNAVSQMIPDTSKIQTNMEKNSLIAKYPGLGAK